MSYKVLHIVDVWLPETMNWLEALLNLSSTEVDHHIYSKYLVTDISKPFISAIENQEKVNYPISLKDKLRHYFNSRTAIDHIKLYCTQHSIDCIHFHFGNIALEFSDLIYDLSLKRVVSLYGYDYEFLPARDSSIVSKYSKLAQCGAEFIVEGSYSKLLLQKYGIPIQQIHIVHMMFQRNFSQKRLPLSRPIVLTQIATYTEKKGQDVLLMALSRFSKEEFTLRCFGEIANSEYYNSLERLKDLYQLDNVSLNGKIGFDQVYKELSGSHFCINLSKVSPEGDTEGGCPVIIKDAIQMGKPILSTKHCDIPDFFVSGYNSFIVQENNIDAIIQMLNRLLIMTQKEYQRLCYQAVESAEWPLRSELSKKEMLTVYYS